MARRKLLWMSDAPMLVSGFGTVTRDILARLPRDRFDVRAVGWGHSGWPYDREAFPYDIYPSNPNTFGRDSLQGAVNHFRPDIIVGLADVWMLAALAELPRDGTFRKIAYYPLDGAPFPKEWRATLEQFDALVAYSEFGRAVTLAACPDLDIELIYHGIDTNVFRPLDKAEVKQKFKVEGKFVVGCVARNQPRKQLPLLIRAFAQFHRSHPDSVLLLHTDPDDIGWDLDGLVTRYGVDDATIISRVQNVTRGISAADLNFVYNCMDVMALPTAGEGFGLPIVEAMAAGVPVVVTDYSACKEFAEGRGELIAVKEFLTMGRVNIDHAVINVDDLTAKLVKLANDPALRERYARDGRAFAETLDWDRIMPQWLELLERV